MNQTRAEQFFTEVKPSTVARYTEYWDSVKPVTVDDYFRRYLFAFTSVHTNWEGNVRGYNAIKDLGWFGDKENLRDRLIFARCGMFNVRAMNIWQFKEQFYANTDFYCNVNGDWVEYRNKLVDSIVGLGIAKVSFTLEMCFPVKAEVSCIDTHGIQLYEITDKSFQTKKGMEVYQKTEQHWIDCSATIDASSYVSRCIYWDKKQGRRNSRYWSYVLEN